MRPPQVVSAILAYVGLMLAQHVIKLLPIGLRYSPRCTAVIRLAAIAWAGGLGDARRGRGQLA